MMSVAALSHVVSPSQLTQEFDGTFLYDNDEWIHLRMV